MPTLPQRIRAVLGSLPMAVTLLITIGIVLAYSGPAQALTEIIEPRDSSTKAQAPTRTLTGEIVDLPVYLREGPGGREQADGGAEEPPGALALLVRPGILYLLMEADQPGEASHAPFATYLNQRVTIMGALYQRSGMRGLVVTSMIPLEAPVSSPPSDNASALTDY